jgi:hypothetical protein
MKIIPHFALCIFLVPFACHALETAVSNPLTEDMQKVAAAVESGHYAYQVAEHLSLNFGSLPDGRGNKYMVMAGSRAAHETAAWIEAEMNRIGLEGVVKEEFPIHAYELNGSSLKIVGEEPIIRTTAMAQTPPTPKGGITAELIDVGNGTRDEYAGKDVTGKIILMSFSWEKQFYFNAAMYEAKLQGAVGIVYDFLGQQQIPDSLYSYPLSPFGDHTLPALNISHNSMSMLREKLANGSIQVSMGLDAIDAFDGKDFNIYGTIKGSKYPDELIVIGDHFDHYFYGSLDCGTCVSSVLGLAKAFKDSAYQPERTLVFIAHGAEENGWHTAWGPYINGAWNNIARMHPDWVGRTVAFMGWDWSGDIGSTTAMAQTYTNEMATFLKGMDREIDHFFSTTLPWSDYYTPYSIAPEGGLSHQGWDALAYSNAGIPVFDIRAAKQTPKLTSVYHTEYDDMSRISGEAMALGMIGTGFAVIKLDQAEITPYDFSEWSKRLKTKLVAEQNQVENHDIKLEQILKTLGDFTAKSASFSGLIRNSRMSSKAASINAGQRSIARNILPHMYYSAGDFPYASLWRHEQYLRDASALKTAINALNANQIAEAHAALLSVTSAYYGSNVSHEVHRAWIDFEPYGLFAEESAGPRIPDYVDVWQEVEALKNTESSASHAAQLSSLQIKYQQTRERLIESLEEMSSSFAGQMEAIDHLISAADGSQ